MSSVSFYVNNKLARTDTVAPYTYNWKVPGKRATFTLKATAKDAAGNIASSTSSVTSGTTTTLMKSRRTSR